MEITKVKIRFSKYLAETDKAYRLEYRKHNTLWIPKKYCWDLMVAGNDRHAWAVMPTWFANLKLEINIDELFKGIGTDGLKERFDIVPCQTIEKHTPEPKQPILTNNIKDLER
ncbi:MAG: hypothetical protein QM642_01825 [Edaphocola sp.]